MVWWVGEMGKGGSNLQELKIQTVGKQGAPPGIHSGGGTPRPFLTINHELMKSEIFAAAIASLLKGHVETSESHVRFCIQIAHFWSLFCVFKF